MKLYVGPLSCILGVITVIILFFVVFFFAVVTLVKLFLTSLERINNSV